jgi:GNAT superfamily N-acetyltransferase
VSVGLQVVPLGEEHLAAAAALAARRFARLRERRPLLPARYASPTGFLSFLRDLAAGNLGVAALRDGRLVGYLAGWCMPNFRGQRSVYSPEWANGAEPGEGRAIYEALYRHLAAEWVADRYVAHYLSVFPDDDGALGALHWLGFGMHAVDALRGLEPVSRPGRGGVGMRGAVEIRRAEMNDLEALLGLDDRLWQHIAGTPCFLPLEKRAREGWVDWLQDPARRIWLALHAGKPAAFLHLGPANDDVSTIVVDEGTTSVYGAFTRREVRGRGIQSALLDHALKWARETGYARCAVDFESANLKGRRFWLRHFNPVCLSLLRQIGAPLPQPHRDPA